MTHSETTHRSFGGDSPVIDIRTSCRCGFTAADLQAFSVSPQNHERPPGQAYQAYAVICGSCGIVGPVFWAESRGAGLSGAIELWDKSWNPALGLAEEEGDVWSGCDAI